MILTNAVIKMEPVFKKEYSSFMKGIKRLLYLERNINGTAAVQGIIY